MSYVNKSKYYQTFDKNVVTIIVHGLIIQILLVNIGDLLEMWT